MKIIVLSKRDHICSLNKNDKIYYFTKYIEWRSLSIENHVCLPVKFIENIKTH